MASLGEFLGTFSDALAVGNAGRQGASLGTRERVSDMRATQEAQAKHTRETKAKADEKTTAFIREQRKLILANGLEALKTAPASVRPKVEAALGRFAVQNMGMDPAVIPSLFATIPPVETLNAQALQKELEKSAIGSATAGSQIAAAQGGGLGVLEAPAAEAKWLNVPRGTQAVRVDPETGKTEVVHTNTNVKPPVRNASIERADFANEEANKIESKFGNDQSLSAQFQLTDAADLRKVGMGLMTPGNFGKRKEKREELAVNVVKFDHAAEAVDRILETNPAAATYAANVAQGLTTMVANIGGLTALIPGVDGQIGKFSDYEEQLEDLGVKSAELRVSLFNIAMMDAVASGLAQGRMSKFALEKAIKNVAVDAREPSKIKAKVKEVGERMRKSLRARLEIGQGDYSSVERGEPPRDFSSVDRGEPTAEELRAMSDAEFNEYEAKVLRFSQGNSR